VGAPTDSGWRVVDVWESAEKFQAFGEVLKPIMEKHGVAEAEPVVLPVHYRYDGNIVHVST